MYINKGVIVFENEDYSNLFSGLDDTIEYPKTIERNILEIVHLYTKTGYNCKDKNIIALLTNLNDDFVSDVINLIDNELYVEEGKTNYSGKHLAYLMYYMPCNTHKIQKVLGDLILRGKLKSSLSILDLGTGPGSIPVGIVYFFKRIAENLPSDEFSISMTIVDADKTFIEIAKKMIEKTKKYLPQNLFIYVKDYNLEINDSVKINKTFDLITMSNFLNIFEANMIFDRIKFFNKLKNALKEDGALILIEPGARDTCTEFKKLRNDIINNNIFNLFAPCNSLWEQKTEYNCTCFSSARVIWQKPDIIKYLNDKGLKKKRENVPYNYAIFTKMKSKKYSILSEEAKNNYVPLKDVKHFIGKRVNIIGLVRCYSMHFEKIYISICDGSYEVEESKAVWIYMDTQDPTVNSKYGKLLNTMNVGQKIEIQNGLCEQGKKYPNSTYIYIDKDTKVTGYF